MAMVYFNRTKQIKSITIKYSNLNEGFIKQIESIVKDIAKQMNIDLSNPTDTNITVYVYSSQMKSYFRNLFGEELTQREKQGAKAQMNFVISDEGEIHLLLSSASDNSKLAKILVSTIFSGFIETKKISSVEKATKEIIDREDEKEEEELEPEIEESEEDIIEEETEQEEIDEIEEAEIADEIEEIIEKKEVDIPVWLESGWYRYKNGYMNKDRSNDLGEYLETHKVGNVKKMSDTNSLIQDYNYKNEFECIKVEYIVKTYGIKMLLKYFENPKEENVFKISEKQFNDDWKKYVKETYFKEKEEILKNIDGTIDTIDTKKQEKVIE